MSALRRLLARLRDRVDRVAAGANPPAGQEPDDPTGQRTSTARERGDMRRRLRHVARRREALLLELGALSFELHRRQRERPELVRHKVAALTALGSEAEALAGALATAVPLIQAPPSAPAGECAACAAALAPDSAFCGRCGTPARQPAPASGPPVAGTPAHQTPAATVPPAAGAPASQAGVASGPPAREVPAELPRR